MTRPGPTNTKMQIEGMPANIINVDLEIQRATGSETTPDNNQFQLWVERAVSSVETGRSVNEYHLVIRIVDEGEGQRLNHEYRAKDYATNVLSFAAELPEGLPPEIRQSQLGDLLVCAPIVAREAKEQGKQEANHWAHLTIHGVLHLLGYDHEQSQEALIMEKLETDILAELRKPDPYKSNI